MADGQPSEDCPFKKLRTMFPAVDGETGEDGTLIDPEHATSQGTCKERDAATCRKDMDADETEQNQIKMNHDENYVFHVSQNSGKFPCSLSDEIDNVSHIENHDTGTSCAFNEVTPAEVLPSSKLDSFMQGVMQNSTVAALAENAYIINKENEMFSGRKKEWKKCWNNSGKPNLKADESDLMKSDESDQDKIIAFDRADFEFDYFGVGTRKEADGSLFHQGDNLSDTGFMEMFSNSVMSSVIEASSCTAGQSCGSDIATTSLFTDYGACSSKSLYEPVKLPNVPFVLDSNYLEYIINQNNVNSLPQTLLVTIFKLLSPCTLLRKAGLVCKYWYNLCRDPELWRRIHMRFQYKLTDVVLSQLIDFSDRVLEVNLADCRFVTGSGVRRLIAKCRNLQSLILKRSFDLNDATFANLKSQGYCADLQTLHLDGCCKITDATVIEISHACPDLSTLHLNFCTKVTDAGFISLAQHCHHITQLILDHCCQVTDKGLIELVLGCPCIKFLNLNSCLVTDKGIRMLSKLVYLESLDVSNVPQMTPSSIVYVSMFCKHLDCINISLNSVIDDGCIAALAENLPKLKRLYCVSCSISDEGLKQMAAHRHTLQVLDVGWCQEVTDTGVRTIAHGCPHLTYFGLIRCDKVTPDVIEELVMLYPHINFSTFILESRRLLEMARKEGYQFDLKSQ